MKQQNTKRAAPIGAGLILMSSFFYASYGIWTTLLGDYFDGFTSTIYRSILVVAILIPIAFFYKKLQPIAFRKNWPYLLGMFIASLFIWGPLYYAIINAGVGASLAVGYASIVVGMLIAGRIFAGERLTLVKLLSGLVGIIGVGLIFIPSLSGIGWIALLAAVVSGLTTAVNTVFAKQIHYNATQSTIAMWMVGIFSNIVMAFIFSPEIPAITLDIEWLYLIIFALASVVASWAFVGGLKRIDAGIAGILGLSEIVFGVLFGITFFHEQPSGLVIAGVITIIIAAALPYIKGKTPKKAPPKV